MNIWKKVVHFFKSGAPAWGVPQPKKPGISIKDLEKKTKKELESIGRKMGIELDRRLTKQKLINKIKFRARNKVK